MKIDLFSISFRFVTYTKTHLQRHVRRDHPETLPQPTSTNQGKLLSFTLLYIMQNNIAMGGLPRKKWRKKVDFRNIRFRIHNPELDSWHCWRQFLWFCFKYRICIHLGPLIRIRFQRYKMKGKAKFNLQMLAFFS